MRYRDSPTEELNDPMMGAACLFILDMPTLYSSSGPMSPGTSAKEIAMNTGFLNQKRIVLILVAVLLTYGAPSISAEVVSIPDPNLRAAIEKALGKASGATITADEMTTLTQLHAREANISDLAGLEHAINLKFLDLYNNSISDISPVAGLTKLTTLYLYSNSISNLSALSDLINLTRLWLQENNISDLSPLVSNTG